LDADSQAALAAKKKSGAKLSNTPAQASFPRRKPNALHRPSETSR
jgi:hypothetical protein